MIAAVARASQCVRGIRHPIVSSFGLPRGGHRGVPAGRIKGGTDGSSPRAIASSTVSHREAALMTNSSFTFTRYGYLDGHSRHQRNAGVSK